MDVQLHVEVTSRPKYDIIVKCVGQHGRLSRLHHPPDQPRQEGEEEGGKEDQGQGQQPGEGRSPGNSKIHGSVGRIAALEKKYFKHSSGLKGT